MNAIKVLGNMPTFDYYHRPSNKAFTNLTTKLTPPMNLRSLLGLGLKFILPLFELLLTARLVLKEKGHITLNAAFGCIASFVKYTL